MTYSKYNNIKTNGCDSRKEARRLAQLRLLEKAGEICNLRQQVKYVLIPTQYETYPRFSKKGKRLKDGIKLVERKVEYVADFVYTNAETGENIVEDTKGVRTKDYVLKRKLMYAVHGIKIKEV